MLNVLMQHAGKNDGQRDECKNDKANFGGHAVRDEHRKISVLRKLCSVAANVLKKIFDDPAADNGIIRHDQDWDNGVNPAAGF